MTSDSCSTLAKGRNSRSSLSKQDLHGITFKNNKAESVHRWFPYIEGFAGSFVRDTLENFDLFGGPVLDPFGGCGSTALECSLNKTKSWSIDINPFMVFVARTKTSLNLDLDLINSARKQLENKLSKTVVKPAAIISKLFFDKDYFCPPVLQKVANAKACIAELRDEQIRNLFGLGLASILVPVSNLKRAPDLKFRTDKLTDAPVYEMLFEKLDQFAQDIGAFKNKRFAKANVVHDSASNITYLGKPFNHSFRAVITSPPYLNGTNYCRNTKLELWIFDYLKATNGLNDLRRKSITASINSTHLDHVESPVTDSVRLLVKKIETTAYDRRIPVMVNNYFWDMKRSLSHMYRLLKRDGDCILVLGDSMFGGIHVPTDVLLAEIGEGLGFKLQGFNIVRERKSRGGAKLQETILHLKKG